jgi:hypothetical protein
VQTKAWIGVLDTFPKSTKLSGNEIKADIKRVGISRTEEIINYNFN